MKRAGYGLLAEFSHPEPLRCAVREVRNAGYVFFDAFTPLPVEGLDEAMGVEETKVPLVVFFAGLLGLLSAAGLQYWVSSVVYPLDIGGRPNPSWPAFIPVMFEVTVLFAALAGVVALIAACGLPRPHHPLFGVPRFELASQSRFFLAIEARDPQFDLENTRTFLAKLGPDAIEEVDA